MEQLSEHNQSILAQNPFLSPEALVKQTRESIRELESTLTYCQGQQDLLRSQREQSGVLLADRQKELQDCRVRIQELESIRTTGFDGSDLKERLADLYSLHEELFQALVVGYKDVAQGCTVRLLLFVEALPP